MKNLKDLIRIKSFDMNDNSEIIECLIEKFAPFAVQILKVKNANSDKNNLIIGLNTEIKDIECIVLAGHIDTVPADEREYNTNPYEAVEKDNKLYGLGVIDMKCFFSSILDNIAQLKNISCPIIICITSDEETELDGHCASNK